MPADAAEPPKPLLVRVPAVLHLSLDDAKKKLEDAGLTFAAANAGNMVPPAKYDMFRQGWRVARQNPIATQEPGIKKGTTIVCVFERENPQSLPTPAVKVKVPSLTGHSLDDAKAIAQREGLTVQTKLNAPISSRPAPDMQTAGKTLVLVQEPPAGEAVARGTTIEVTMVTYTVASPKLENVQVPDLTGMTLVEAQMEARRFHLDVRSQPGAAVIDRPTRDPRLAGKVVVRGQRPMAGAAVAKGTPVDVSFTRHVMRPDDVMVPSFQGKSQAEAEAMAQQHGLCRALPQRHDW
jgi:beta-lactam-binding protein with PASTA domain